MLIIGSIHCANCHTALGRVVNHKEKPYFDDGISLILTGLRRCHCCGQVFHWHGDKLSVEQAQRGFGQQNGATKRTKAGAW